MGIWESQGLSWGKGELRGVGEVESWEISWEREGSSNHWINCKSTHSLRLGKGVWSWFPTNGHHDWFSRYKNFQVGWWSGFLSFQFFFLFEANFIQLVVLNLSHLNYIKLCLFLTSNERWSLNFFFLTLDFIRWWPNPKPLIF